MHVIAGAWSRRTCVTRCVTVAGRVTTRRIVVSFLVVFKKVIAEDYICVCHATDEIERSEFDFNNNIILLEI